MRNLLILVASILAALFANQANEARKLAESRKQVINLQAEEYKELQAKYDSQTSTVTPAGQDSTADTINWVSWKEAPAIAREKGLPSLLHFTRGSSCLPCENLRRNVFTDQRVVDASRQFVCVEFLLADKASEDSEENKAALRAFGIDREGDGIPQDVFLNPSWEGRGYIVLGGKMPKVAAEYVNYLNSWAGELNKDK